MAVTGTQQQHPPELGTSYLLFVPLAGDLPFGIPLSATLLYSFLFFFLLQRSKF